MVHKKGFLKEDIFSIHKMILKGIDDSHAGVIRSVPVRISGSPVILPNYLKLPTLLDTFIQDFTATTDHPVKQAALAHYNIVTIHPFIDGNGRTARIIMNLILMQHGYPPAIIRPQDRLRYIKSLEKAQLGGSMEDYFSVIETAVLRSLGIYIKAFTQKPLVDLSPHLLKIGDLAKQTQESVASLRYWTKIGLLEVSTTTPSGYQLYDRHQIERCAKIRELQKQRYTLDEIGGLMGG
jgi:Fic family protein